MTSLDGAIVSDGRAHYFVPSSVARYVVPWVRVTQVPGSRLGLAPIDGRVLSVVSLGPKREHLLVCELSGQLVAIAGVTVLASGKLGPETLAAHAKGGRELATLDVAECFRVALGGEALDTPA